MNIKTSKIFLILLTIIIVGIVGYLAYKKELGQISKEISEPKAKSAPQPPPKPTPPPPLPPSPTAEGIKTGKIFEIENWKIYKNQKYGFELKYPSHWRTNLEIKTSFLNRFSLISEAHATPEYDVDLSDYEGTEILEIWFQNPQFDNGHRRKEFNGGRPQYYQSSSYNSAPLGIYIIIYANGRYDEKEKENEIRWGWRKTITFKNIEGYKVTPSLGSDLPEVWSTERIEVKKAGYLFVLFFAGKQYRPDFEEFLNNFKFTE